MRLVATAIEQKSAPASGEKLGPGAAKIAEQRVCISFEATDKRWGVLTFVRQHDWHHHDGDFLRVCFIPDSPT
jgi:hypothetical protein